MKQLLLILRPKAVDTHEEILLRLRLASIFIVWIFLNPGFALSGQEPKKIQPELSFLVPETLLALEGDIEYGEYLSGECKACHKSYSENASIPTIENKPNREIKIALFAFREGYRENEAMQMIAKRLTNEEIAALAHYFESIGN